MKSKINTETKRYYLIDAIRGIAILNMVGFHFLFDFNILFGQNPNWHYSPSVYIWQQGICFTYIIIAGLVWRYGINSHKKRGLFLLIASLIISIVTQIVIPNEAIWFGILSFLGCAILLTIPLNRLLKKVPTFLGLFISCILFLLSRNVQLGYIGVGNHILVAIPSWFYDIKILTPFGFPYDTFSSSDYFPIFPWIFLFWAGYYFSSIIQPMDGLTKILRLKIPLLTYLGQHSLLIYFLHQPICYVICMLFFSLN